MRILTFALCLLCFSVSALNAQLTGISVETYLVHDGVAIPELEGFTTYLVYANTTNSEDFVSAVFGDSDDAMAFSSAGTVFQSTPNYNYGNEPNPALFSVLPMLEYDSWMTIGMMSSSDEGAISNIGMADAMAEFSSMGSFYIDDPIGGSWFYPGFPCGATPIVECADQYAAFGGADNKVLLAQITTDDSFNGVFNVQIIVNGLMGNSTNYNGVAFSSDMNDTFGCNDPNASNYDATATVDDLSCVFPCSLALVIESITSPTCNGDNDGSLIITSTGAQGSDDYYFGVDDESPSNFGIFNDLVAGDYEIIIVDGEGCEVSQTVTVPVTETVSLSATLTESISCNDTNDAVITVSNAMGGDGNLLFQIQGAPETSTNELVFSGLGAGTYTVIATDGNGCSGNSTATLVNNPTAIQVFVTNSSPASCFNETDGQIVVSAFGGAVPASITFSVNGESGLSSPLMVPGGTYTVIGTDINGCSGSSDEVVVEVDGYNYECGCADIPEGECDCFGTLPDAIGECGGSCENDINNNGICDLFDTGCVFSNACNYDPEALFDNGSCVFYCPGCTDAVACNYDAYFLQDDGSCVYPGCDDSASCNYDSAVGCNDGSCLYFDECGICGGVGTLGCTDAIACNYDISAGCDDGTCLYFDECGICGGVGTLGCTTLGACNYDNTAVCDDNSCEYTSCAGCQYEFACNYDAEATIADNVSCEFGTCPGCTDFSACNYNPTLTEDDGSCEYCSCISVTPSIVTIDLGLAENTGALDILGFNYTILSPSEFSVANLIEFDILYIGWTSDASNEGMISLVEKSSDIEVFLSQGGGLYAASEHEDYNFSWEWLPFDISYQSLTAESVNIIDYNHPVNIGLTNEMLSNWGSSIHNVFLPNEYPDYLNAITIEGVTGLPLTLTGNYNDTGGKIVLTGQDPDYHLYYDGNYSSGVFIANAIEWLTPASESACDCDGNGNVLDECGVCGGDGIPEGDCDCYGNVLDECGVCGGSGISEGDCDCEGNMLDAAGICGGDCEDDYNSNGVCDDQEVYGCTYPEAMNFDSLATVDDGSCDYYGAFNPCPSDLDGNGIVGSPDLLLFLSAYGDVCE